MGVYLNQLPPTEVARLKAELAETLIAHFCYPRFFDYRTNTLRTRPVDHAKRQEVWQYLNAVDFQVWGRVDVDSPDFQHQVERLFIHFVQRNRNFFGEQGRKRMVDVRSLITQSSLTLAESVRKHLQGKHSGPPLGTPRPVASWCTKPGTERVDISWEQILTGTMQLQQQLQEARGEVAPLSPSHKASPSATQAAVRSSRASRSTTREAAHVESRDKGALAWPPTDTRPPKAGERRLSVSFPAGVKEAAPAYPPFASGTGTSTPDAAPTMPLPLGRSESAAPLAQPSDKAFSESSARPKRPRAEAAPATPFLATPPSGPVNGAQVQAVPISAKVQSAARLPTVAPTSGVPVKPGEQTAAVMSDEDVVIFEQLRYQLVVELRVEAVRAGLEASGQGAFQLVDTLRHQEGMDLARLQVVSTLLNMCDQVIAGGHATLSDYKQAMMFYLMYTRRSR